MKYFKMMAFLGLAGVATMGFAASSASANARVCSPTQGNTALACQAGHGNVYEGEIHAVLATGTTVKFVSGFITVTCSESTILGSVNGTNGAGSLTGLNFATCNSFLGACTYKSSAAVGNPWPTTNTTDGLSTSTDGLVDVNNITLEFTCAGETCRYVNENSPAQPEPTIDGSSSTHDTARIIATNVKLKKEAVSGSLCSNTATWNGTYSITTPDTLVVE